MERRLFRGQGFGIFDAGRRRGRGAFRTRRSRTARSGGACRSAYAGMSSDNPVEKTGRRKPKVSWGRLIRPGLVDT